jgi:cellobiose phosphorylase
VAFSALYAGNLRTLADLCLALSERGVAKTELAFELATLLDGADLTLSAEKQGRLQSYFDQVRRGFSGKKPVPLAELAPTCAKKRIGW